MIPQSTIQQVKNQTNLINYIQSRGTKLKKAGKEYTGLCPFHDDHNPSFSVDPKKQLWYCHSCDIGGDVIKFVRLLDIVPFEEAVNRLSGDVPKGKTTSGQINGADDGVRGGALSRPVLLKSAKGSDLRNIFDFYCRTFAEDRQGAEYLQSRRLSDPQLFKTFSRNKFGTGCFGFANGKT